MTNKIFHVLILFSLVFLFSCNNDDNTPSTTTIGSDFFIEGKGMRKVWGMQSERVGLGAFNLNKLTITSDGYINTAFTYANANANGAPADYTAYRKKINITTGDTVETFGIPAQVKITYIGQSGFGCGEFDLVPYTDKLVYSDLQFIYGDKTNDPNWPRMTFGEGNGFEKIYATRQALCQGLYEFSGQNLGVRYFGNEKQYAYVAKKVNNQAIASSVEMPINGGPIAFLALKSDSLLVLDFNSNTVLAKVQMNLFSQYLPSNSPWNYKPTSRIVTKRNSAGTKIIGTVFHSANYFPLGNGRMISTFVYDIATKVLTLKVQNSFLNTGFYLTETEDVDDDGNYYYQVYVANPTIDTKITINKITPTNGNTLYKTGFLNQSSSLKCLRVVSNKLIIACGVDGNSYYSDQRGKGSIIIAVEQ